MIGIIGGNGVAATNKLCELIEIQKTRNGAYRDAHHQEMVIWQATKAPSRSMYLEGKGPSFIDDYVRIGLQMKSCGVGLICMCCNTAHYAIDILEKKIELPFINLIDEVAKEVCKMQKHKVGIMCSEGCRNVGLYDKSFMKLDPEIEIIYPDDNFQKLVTLGICNVKNKSRFTDETDSDNPSFIFSQVIEHLECMGVDCIIAGCTDIRCGFSPDLLYSNIDYIDSLEVLSRVIIQTSYE